MRARAAAVAASWAHLALACASGRDAIPETHDTRVAAPTTDPTAAKENAYVHLARRPLGDVGLAEARGMTDADAAHTVDHLADALDTCATELGRQGKLVDGAARVIVRIGASGAIDGLNVTLAPGSAVAANALLCLITPIKMMTFEPVDAGTRAFAIEAAWGPRVAAGK